MSWGDLIRRAFGAEPEPPLHPLYRKLAKEWVKRRLLAVFPELRDRPRALEQAYRDLSLDPRPGSGPGEPETVFDLRLPADLEGEERPDRPAR